jgi:hypothetical protein
VAMLRRERAGEGHDVIGKRDTGHAAVKECPGLGKILSSARQPHNRT